MNDHIVMRHYNINDGSRTVSSIGEGMVDINAVNHDHRVFAIRRAAANLIDLIEQLEVPAGDHGTRLKQRGMELVQQAAQSAIEAAMLRERQPAAEPPLEYTHEHPEGAPV